jgi:hypothetical protein
VSELVVTNLVETAEVDWRVEYPTVPALTLRAPDAERAIEIFCARQGVRRAETDEVMAKFHCYQVEPAKGE